MSSTPFVHLASGKKADHERVSSITKEPSPRVSVELLNEAKDKMLNRPSSLQANRRASFGLAAPIDLPGLFKETIGTPASPTGLSTPTQVYTLSSGSPMMNRERRSSFSGLNRGSDEWLSDVVDRMLVSLPTKDHRSGIRYYKNTFSGEAFVAWLRGSGSASTVTQAIDYGNKMIGLGLIIPCDKGGEMVNDSYYYKFKSEPVAEVVPDVYPPFDLEITFQDLLQHPKGVIMFEEFCKKEFNTENLYFWSAVVDYRDKFDEFNAIILEAANQILDHYVNLNAKEGLNVPAKIRENTIAEFKEKGATPTLFDKPAEEIHGLMKKDTFRRFIQQIKKTKEANK